MKQRLPWRWSSSVLSQLPAPAQSLPTDFPEKGSKGCLWMCKQNSMKSLVYIRGCTRLNIKGILGLHHDFFHIFPFLYFAIQALDHPHSRTDCTNLQTVNFFILPLSLFHLNFSHPLLCLGKAQLSNFSPYCTK